MSKQDKIMSNEELKQNVSKILEDMEAYYLYEPGNKGNFEKLLDLINTQKRLYAESVLMPIKNIYMQADYEGTDEDMIQEIIRATEDGFRAEQRKRNNA